MPIQRVIYPCGLRVTVPNPISAHMIQQPSFLFVGGSGELFLVGMKRPPTKAVTMHAESLVWSSDAAIAFTRPITQYESEH